MIQVQIISKILNTHSFAIVEDYLLTEDNFKDYRTEFDFIRSHYLDYGNVPDKVTFLDKFPDFEITDVTESDDYLIEKIQEETLYSNLAPILKKTADISQEDSNVAMEYLMGVIRDGRLNPSHKIGGIDIISKASERYDAFVDRKNHQDEWFFTTGFPELDDVIHGIQRQEEFVVLFARTNQGKSWILEKICTHIWQIGFNVGYISPEMSPISVGYRFDTLFKNYSNRDLMWGNKAIADDEYKSYTDELATHTNKFIVSTPMDFGRKITVSKIRQYIQKYKLDVVAIDGIKYMTDERKQKGDNLTTSLTNISEDLMELSIELGVPVLVVVQANRGGVMDGQKDGTPELEHIKDSDGISQNASKVLSIRQKDNILEIGIKKQRFGAVGGKLKYNWEINTGNFSYIQSFDEQVNNSSGGDKKPELGRINKPKTNDKSDVF